MFPMQGLSFKSNFAIIVVGVLLFGLSCGMFTRPNDIKIADPVRALADARRIIADQRAKRANFPISLAPNDLPESLRIPGLRFSHVYSDHLELVLARNPDWEIGARIWSVDSTELHQDKTTKYPEVFYFVYDNDEPKSPTNIP